MSTALLFRLFAQLLELSWRDLGNEPISKSHAVREIKGTQARSIAQR